MLAVQVADAAWEEAGLHSMLRAAHTVREAASTIQREWRRYCNRRGPLCLQGRPAKVSPRATTVRPSDARPGVETEAPRWRVRRDANTSHTPWQHTSCSRSCAAASSGIQGDLEEILHNARAPLHTSDGSVEGLLERVKLSRSLEDDPDFQVGVPMTAADSPMPESTHPRSIHMPSEALARMVEQGGRGYAFEP